MGGSAVFTHSSRQCASRPAISRGSHGYIQSSSRRKCAVTRAIAVPPIKESSEKAHRDQVIRNGDTETSYVQVQAAKDEENQRDVGTYLSPHDVSTTADVCIVGCGPAGLALSAQVAEKGLKVCLVGPEAKFTNNYGVWVDEFKSLDMEHLLDHVWDKSVCYFSDTEKLLERAYGRVNRAQLRDHLLTRCAATGVTYVPAIATDINAQPDAETVEISTENGVQPVRARLATLAGGAVSSKFLDFETQAPRVAAQTAYGITARVKNYAEAYDPSTMVFMDYRRIHSGMWDSTATKIQPLSAAKTAATGDEVTVHPNWEGELGTTGEAPSFLYVMPLDDGSVFLEETCLVARPTLPFSALKRRLERRCAAMGIEIEEVLDEEFSYIPVGGPMPLGNQTITAFGAAANLVHPATGYSIARMLHETGPLATTIADTLSRNATVGEYAHDVWAQLWPQEKRTQASFHVFGMELLATLEIRSIHQFFETFFRLPDRYWRGFLGSKLSSGDLLVFALLTFVTCSGHIRTKLMGHLFTSDSGMYMINSYALRFLGVGTDESQMAEQEKKV